jgi:hypothetical protein
MRAFAIYQRIGAPETQRVETTLLNQRPSGITVSWGQAEARLVSVTAAVRLVTVRAAGVDL